MHYIIMLITLKKTKYQNNTLISTHGYYFVDLVYQVVKRTGK